MSPADVISFADFLIQKGHFDDAQRIWQQAFQLSDVVTGDPPGSVLSDGGFESSVRGGGFAWAFPAPSPGVQTVSDCRQKPTGKLSLSLFFNCTRNTTDDRVCAN